MNSMHPFCEGHMQGLKTFCKLKKTTSFQAFLLAGLLEPLPIGAANFRERLDGLLAAMSADILGRVMGDRAEEDRSAFLLGQCFH